MPRVLLACIVLALLGGIVFYRPDLLLPAQPVTAMSAVESRMQDARLLLDKRQNVEAKAILDEVITRLDEMDARKLDMDVALARGQARQLQDRANGMMSGRSNADLRRAIELATMALNHNPDDAHAYQVRATAYTAVAEYAKAQEDRQRYNILTGKK